MSNSIWKTPDQKPEKEPIIIRCANGAIISCPSFVIRKFSDGDTWAYLHEVVNQADKAERLQKAVDFLSGLLNIIKTIGITEE